MVKKKVATKKKVVSKSVASKKKVVKKKAVRKSLASSTITNEQHYLMVSEAAFHLSEKQGFNPASDMDNWLEAEKQIAAMMKSGNISLAK